MNKHNLPVWEYLAKELIYRQLPEISDLNILDFGSGNGATASHFAKNNNVTAVEPDVAMLKNRISEHEYTQIVGGLNDIRKMPSESFDMIICHNVLEYTESLRKDIVNEFYRLLKFGGKLSIVKHNRNGRVMQMAVLLNNFDEANRLLNGKGSHSQQFGTISYYNDEDITKWCGGFKLIQMYGLRTFFDLQQNQEIQKTASWQERMLSLEELVSVIDEYKKIAFFHHLIFEK